MIKNGELHIIWCIEDVHEQAEHLDIRLTDNEALEVLKYLDRKHDCNYGIAWDNIEFAILELFT